MILGIRSVARMPVAPYWRWVFLAALLCCFLIKPALSWAIATLIQPAAASATPSAEISNSTTAEAPITSSQAGDLISLDFQDIELRAVLQLLADFKGLNLVASDAVQGRLTLHLNQVPWQQALDIVLDLKGLGLRRRGNVLMIAPIAEFSAQEQLKLAVQQQRESLMPLVSALIRIRYAKAADLAEVLRSASEHLATPNRGSVSVDQRTNALLVQDTPQRLQQLRALVRELDQPMRQVSIEARVVIANDNFARELGVRFGATGSIGNTGGQELLVGGGVPGHLGNSSALDKGGFMGDYDPRFYQIPSANAGPYRGSGVPLQPVNSTIQLPAGSGSEALMVNLPAPNATSAINLLLGKVGSHLVQLELSAMQMEGRGEIVSTPRVVTSDQAPARIEVGQQIPYATVSQNGTNTEFKDATLRLDVTPHITPDGRILMDLLINKDAPNYAARDASGLPIDRRSIETSVLVNDGETLVLGGVFEHGRSLNRGQVPLLGDIPGIGRLFRSTQRSQYNQELLIFVTPTILESTDGS